MDGRLPGKWLNPSPDTLGIIYLFNLCWCFSFRYILYLDAEDERKGNTPKSSSEVKKFDLLPEKEACASAFNKKEPWTLYSRITLAEFVSEGIIDLNIDTQSLEASLSLVVRRARSPGQSQDRQTKWAMMSETVR